MSGRVPANGKASEITGSGYSPDGKGGTVMGMAMTFAGIGFFLMSADSKATCGIGVMFLMASVIKLWRIDKCDKHSIDGKTAYRARRRHKAKVK